MYAKSADGINVNLFIGSTVTIENVAGTDVHMVQATDYPWNGKVSLTISPKVPQTFSIRIRVPNRAVSSLYTSTPNADGITSVSVNGSVVKPVLDKGYAVITRAWRAGDRIELVLPLQIQRVRASDKIVADQGRVALRYGPLVYNVEKVDQDITQALGSGTALTTEWKGDFLGGVMVIKGTFADGTPLLAIPNYARHNREPVVPPAPPPTAPAPAAAPPAGAAAAATPRPSPRPPTSIVWIRER
jgi:hypothetical protein